MKAMIVAPAGMAKSASLVIFDRGSIDHPEGRKQSHRLFDRRGRQGQIGQMAGAERFAAHDAAQLASNLPSPFRVEAQQMKKPGQRDR